jgi:hypothetical protein
MAPIKPELGLKIKSLTLPACYRVDRYPESSLQSEVETGIFFLATTMRVDIFLIRRTLV